MFQNSSLSAQHIAFLLVTPFLVPACMKFGSQFILFAGDFLFSNFLLYLCCNMEGYVSLPQMHSCLFTSQNDMRNLAGFFKAFAVLHNLFVG